MNLYLAACEQPGFHSSEKSLFLTLIDSKGSKVFASILGRWHAIRIVTSIMTIGTKWRQSHRFVEPVLQKVTENHRQ